MTATARLLHMRNMIYDFKTFADRQKFKFATCLFFTCGDDDLVEIYLDEIATAAFKSVRETEKALGLNPGDLGDPYDLIMLLISTSLVHEWLHHEGGLDERSVGFATEHLQNAVVEQDWPVERAEEQAVASSRSVPILPVPVAGASVFSNATGGGK